MWEKWGQSMGASSVSYSYNFLVFFFFFLFYAASLETYGLLISTSKYLVAIFDNK